MGNTATAESPARQRLLPARFRAPAHSFCTLSPALPPADAMPGRVGSSEQPFSAQVLSDEEMAWRLHQELNATSPMLRTRSRKAPDLLAATQVRQLGAWQLGARA